MKLKRVSKFLSKLPRYRVASDGVNCAVKCPYCGDSQTDQTGSFNVKIDVAENEGLRYICFRASCGVKGIMNTNTLYQLGCTDTKTHLELSAHNKHLKTNDSSLSFIPKRTRGYDISNINMNGNRIKLGYINERLGVKLNGHALDKLKIQLGLYDFLHSNYIDKLAYKKAFCDLLDAHTVGFLSMYSDYLILRDITPDLLTHNRYTMYRANGKPDKDDMKLYCIPTNIDILDNAPADINVAEGPFSILGAYLHSSHKNRANNNIWIANCGSDYISSIMHVIRQYGLVDVNIKIWSDTEIKPRYYESIAKKLRKMVKVRSFTLQYNLKAEDFGNPANKIKIHTVDI